MDWIDDGFVLHTREHGENAIVATLLTRERGRHAGLVHGGMSSRHRPTWQPGNLVRVEWRARLAEHLGTFKGEMLAAMRRARSTIRWSSAGLASPAR